MVREGGGWMNQGYTSRQSFGLPAVVLMTLLLVCACGNKQGELIQNQESKEIPMLTGDGLVLEGEGPFPATLIARSSNTLSNEENQMILQEISQELDIIMDLASQLEVLDDESISGGNTVENGSEVNQ